MQNHFLGYNITAKMFIYLKDLIENLIKLSRKEGGKQTMRKKFNMAGEMAEKTWKKP